MKLARNIILASIAAVAASCSDDTLPGTNPDNGERTPLNVAVALSNGTPLSRAEGNTFAAGDSLYAYIRQVEWNGTEVVDYSAIGVVTPVTADQSPSLVLFTVNDDFSMTAVDGTTEETSNITPAKPLYWDDFGTAEKPLTATGSYLQSAWGFCYNGGTPTTALDKTNGTIGWTAAADFTPNGVLRNNDLLWSKAQKPLKYDHGTFDRDDHGTLVIPYTHAMSMITIEVVAADGFTTGNLGSTTATLQDMYKSATFSAPNATVSSQDDSQSVAMLAGTEGTNGGKPNKVFQALVIPGKTLTTGIELAVISDIDGNNYKIPVTQTIIDDWREQLDGGNTLKSGVNYKLTVTVAKQAISVVAQITDWVNIEATGEGEIKFNSNIVSSGVTNAITSGSFEIFQGTANTEESLTNVTTATYNAGTSKWELTPQIYWANSTQSYYFRGLATTTDGTTPTATSSKDATQGTDLLWATTPAHDGTLEGGGTRHFDAGVAIPPRTGDVPLQFEHAMSKITVNLSTSTTGKATPTADESARAVDLSNVTVTISNIATAGTIAITDGNIAPTPIAAAVNAAVTGTTPASVSDYTDPIKAIDGTIVIPQSLVNDTYPIKLTIKLSDGTTYSLPLKDCKVSGSETNIETWNRGNHYVYNIYVEKEAIRFVAVIKEWEKVNGSGDANLDWD